MKVKNKFSKKRRRLNKRIQVWISNRIIRWCEKRPNHWLSEICLREVFSEKEKITSGLTIDFNNMILMELVEKEHLHSFKIGISKLFKKNKPKKYMVFNDIERVEEFLDESSTNYDIGGWSHLGLVDFSNIKSLDKYIDLVDIHALQFSPSLIAVVFNIKTTEYFNQEITNKLISDIRAQRFFHWPKISVLIKHKIWAAGSISKEETKNILITDMITELKYRVLKEIKKYIPLYFTENNLLAPSLDVFNTNISHNNKDCDHYWRSLGVDRFSGDLSINAKWGLFLFERSHFSRNTDYNNYKIIYNIKDEINSMYHDKKHYIMSSSSDITKEIYHILLLNSYAKHFEKKISNLRNNLYKILGKRKPSYRKLLKFQYSFEISTKMFSRLFRDVNSDRMERVVKQFSGELVEFKTKFRSFKAFELFYKNIREKLSILNVDVEDLRIILSQNTEITTVRKTYNLTTINVILTILSVIAATISMLVGILGITITVYTIRNSNSGDFKEIIKELLGLWIWA